RHLGVTRSQAHQTGLRTLGRERVQVQSPGGGSVSAVLDKDVEEALGPVVRIFETLHGILWAEAGLVDSHRARHYGARALRNQKQVIVVGRVAEKVVPVQENNHLTVRRK